MKRDRRPPLAAPPTDLERILAERRALESALPPGEDSFERADRLGFARGLLSAFLLYAALGGLVWLLWLLL